MSLLSWDGFRTAGRQGAAAVACMVAALAVGGCGHGGHRATVGDKAQQSASPHAPAFTASDARQLSRNLRAGTGQAVRDAVAIPPGQGLDPAAVAQLAALGTVTFDDSTFHAIDTLDATIVGRIQHPPVGEPSTWTFVLSYVDGTWKIADAEPQS